VSHCLDIHYQVWNMLRKDIHTYIHKLTIYTEHDQNYVETNFTL
jgi:hypothetical protein